MPGADVTLSLESTDDAPAEMKTGAGGPIPTLKKGAKVLVTKYGTGFIRWIGVICGKCVTGVELDLAHEGCSDGTFCGEKLFDCQQGHGLFVPWNLCIPYGPAGVQDSVGGKFPRLDETAALPGTSGMSGTSVPPNARTIDSGSVGNGSVPYAGPVVNEPMLQLAPGGWKCEQCTFFNVAGRPGCEVCSSAPPQANQTEPNGVPDIEMLRVNGHHQPAPPVPPAPLVDPTSGRCICEQCIFSNNPIRTTCEACTTARPFIRAQLATSPLVQATGHTPSQQPPAPPNNILPDGSWTCTFCTLSNGPNQKTCNVCNAPRAMDPSAGHAGQRLTQGLPNYPLQQGQDNTWQPVNTATAATAVPRPTTSSAQKRWTCTQCTLSNNPIRKTCETCDAPRMDMPLPADASPGQFQPAYGNSVGQRNFTLEHQNEIARKLANNAAVAAQAPVRPRANEKRWTCPRCTLSNTPTRKTCETCDAPRMDMSQPVDALPGQFQPTYGNLGGQRNFTLEHQKEIARKLANNAAPAPAPAPAPVRPGANEEAWTCPKCTLRNPPLRPSCFGCLSDRPASYQVPTDYRPSAEERLRQMREQTSLLLFHKGEEDRRRQNYAEYVKAEDDNVVQPDEQFECGICMGDVDPQDGVRLHECLHVFCRNCIAQHVEHSEDIPIRCPYRSDYDCEEVIPDREIKEIVSNEIYERYQKHGFIQGAQQLENRVQCMTADCIGVYELDEAVRQFECHACHNTNCLDCEVIHNMTCHEYQEEQRRIQEEREAGELREAHVRENQASEAKIRDMRTGKVVMNCPHCHVIIEKNGGCPNMTCGNCKQGFKWNPPGH